MLVVSWLGLIHETGCMVIRNAGGRANQSVVNGILVLDSLMGITDIVVAHHTGLSKLASRFRHKTSLTVNDRLRNDTFHRCPDPRHAEEETPCEPGN